MLLLLYVKVDTFLLALLFLQKVTGKPSLDVLINVTLKMSVCNKANNNQIPDSP